MHLILTGATGAVGSSVLNQCLHSPSITKLSILSRRPIELVKGNDKVDVIIHKNYNEYSKEVLDQLKGAQACIWAQGISQLQVDEPEYIRITYDYPIAAAKAFSTLSDKLVFVYVSGNGADQTERASRLFARIKGRAEKDLVALSATYPSLKVYNARPAMVDTSHEPKFPDRNPKWFEKALMPLVGPIMPARLHSPAGKLAEVLELLALKDGEPFPPTPGIEPDGRTIGNVVLRHLVGLK